MNTFELLFTVSSIFWGFVFLYLLWLHSKIKKISTALKSPQKR
jgi:hypothetical protein